MYTYTHTFDTDTSQYNYVHLHSRLTQTQVHYSHTEIWDIQEDPDTDAGMKYQLLNSKQCYLFVFWCALQRHPVKHGMAECKGGSGIPIPVVYDKGDEKSTGQLYGPAARGMGGWLNRERMKVWQPSFHEMYRIRAIFFFLAAEFEPGFITFSASNSEKAPVAICSGVKPTGCNPQYVSKTTYIL